MKKIGIIGVGFVGGALKKYFDSKKNKPFVYDKFKQEGSMELVNKAEIVFISTPTPYNPKKGFDLSAVKEAVGLLKGKKIVVIKSTVLPGTVDDLQKQYPQHAFMFNPEFLKEVSSYEDLIHPDRQILGVTKQSQKYAKIVMSVLPRSPFDKVMPAKEAELVKYMANSFLALKVVFANEIFEIAKALKVNYETVKEAVVKDWRIADSHFSVGHGGYRGYGGSCFPKDVNALLQLAKKLEKKTPLLTTMKKINQQLLKASGLSEEFFLKNLHKKNVKK